MDFKPFQKTYFQDNVLSRFQDAIASFFEQFKQSTIANGVLLEDISIGTSATRIAHKLGTTPRGYIIVKKSASATIYNSSIDENDLYLISSASVTASIWVF